MSFESILGQDAAVGLLKEALTKERIASGYLFFGPDGVGKRKTAFELARAILCSNRSVAEACGECPACVRSRAGSHPGLILVEREETKTQISIGQVQALSAQLALRPMEGDTTVAILDEVERANLEALNALLKTLEEPPPGATLILVTMRRSALPETIRSRCQAVRFRPLARPIVTSILEGRGDIDAGLLPELTERAGGSPGRALRLIELGFPESGRTIRDALATAGETDPVDLAETLLAAVGGSGGKENAMADRRERVREILTLLVEEIRARFLDADTPERDPARADEALGPVMEGLERVVLNVDPVAVLRSVMVRVRSVLH